MRAVITATTVKQLKPGDFLADTEIEGFRARCLPSGAITYGYQYRAGGGRRPWIGLGLHGDITPDEARRLAKVQMGRVADNKDPAAERDRGVSSVNMLLDNFLQRYVEAQGLRSGKEIRRCFDVYVRPHIGGRSIYDLGRGDISSLLDKLEDRHGATQADRVLALLRKACNWQMTRDDKFTSPVIKGMARTKPADRARVRVLDDQEIRDLWQALDEVVGVPPWFPGFVRTLLLTGQRLGNVQLLCSDNIADGVWTIEAEDRRKLKHGLLVPLSKPAQAILAEYAKDDGVCVFSSVDQNQWNRRDDALPVIARFAKPKATLDEAIALVRKRAGRKPMEHWTFHDLRRTARTIMSRYTTPDVAERTIGHVMPGVRGVYDKYEYLDEKRAALEALGRHVMAVVSPRGGNVIALPKSRSGHLARPSTSAPRHRRVRG